jgi:glycosyltransferase involved in cell wall biosynthesis
VAVEHALGVPSIAYYAYDFRRTQASGLVSYVRSMRDALCERGVRVRVIARHADPDDTSAELSAAPRWLRRAASLTTRLTRGRVPSFEENANIARIARKLEQREGTGLFEIEEHKGLGNWLLRTPLRAPVIVRTHGPHFLVAPANRWIYEQAADDNERACALRAFALTVPSHDTLRRIREHWQLELPHARVIPNATPELPEQLLWRGNSAGPILFIGRCDRLKGMDLVVRAFGKISARFPERELWLVGPEFELHEDTRSYKTLAEFLEAALPPEARARVKVLGPKTRDEVQALRREAACVLVASRFETFCLAAIEAMMAGCPVIVPNASALPELVQDGVTGLLFKSEDAADLARAIESLLADPALAARLGAAARSEARRRFAPKVVVEETLRFYQEVLESARRDPNPLLRALRGPRRG